MTYSCGFTGEDRNDIYLKAKEKEHGLYSLVCHGSWSHNLFQASTLFRFMLYY